MGLEFLIAEWFSGPFGTSARAEIVGIKRAKKLPLEMSLWRLEGIALIVIEGIRGKRLTNGISTGHKAIWGLKMGILTILTHNT